MDEKVARMCEKAARLSREAARLSDDAARAWARLRERLDKGETIGDEEMARVKTPSRKADTAKGEADEAVALMKQGLRESGFLEQLENEE